SPASRSWTVDLADLDGVAGFALQADDELGGIDILVNNAGIPKRRHVLELTQAEVDSVMAINYLSPVRLTPTLLPPLIDRGGGAIVTISSVAARMGPPREGAYSASKAAISAFMESMAVDLDGKNIAVHLVNPGIIDTELFELPDNEASLSDLDALPVSAMSEAVLAQLASGQFEIYVPDWFKDITPARYGDLGTFIDGSKDWVRQRLSGVDTNDTIAALEAMNEGA